MRIPCSTFFVVLIDTFCLLWMNLCALIFSLLSPLYIFVDPTQHPLSTTRTLLVCIHLSIYAGSHNNLYSSPSSSHQPVPFSPPLSHIKSFSCSTFYVSIGQIQLYLLIYMHIHTPHKTLLLPHSFLLSPPPPLSPINSRSETPGGAQTN